MTSRQDRIIEQRLDKLDRIRSLGIDPYPARFPRTHTAQQATALLEQMEAGQARPGEVSVAGRITARRKMGKSAFLDIHDDSGKMQLLFQDAHRLGDRDLALFNDLDTGDILGARGTLLRTRTGEPTVAVKGFALLAKSLRPLPEKWHGLSDLETRYRQRYLDLISNPRTRKTFRIRGQVIGAIRRFLDERGFLEVETPVLAYSAGGALATPFVTHHHALDHDFYLRISLELPLKRLVIGGLERVYELGRVFRNEGVSTKHNPEFTLLESYQAYADYNDVMAMVEELVSTVCQQVIGGQEVEFGESTISFHPPWPRIGLREAIREHSGIDFVQYPDVLRLGARMKELGMEVDPRQNWAHLVDQLLSTFVEPRLVQPTFLVDYPVSMSPLAKTRPGQERVVERFEAFAGGIEIANAFTELNDPLEQRERFRQQQRDRQPEGQPGETVDEDFLVALEYGMPPTGGLGMGIDRLVMLLTNHQSIREVILFPQLKDRPEG